jgi:uncharacterized protein (DUF2236 family)
VTTDTYGSAADLVARAARAYVSGIPEDPADDGFFGSASVAWRISIDLSSPVAGLRSLMLQALHPLAMAGVDQHSQWRRDPAGRLAATSAYVTTITFGDRPSAERASAVVRRVHEHVRGTDAVTGQAYEAGDPALLLWVHAALVDSSLSAAELFGTPAGSDADRYVAEMVAAAELVGIPSGMVPATAAELNAFIDQTRPRLMSTPAARESMSYLLSPAGLDEAIADIWQDIADAAVASLPQWAAGMYGYDRQALTAERRSEIRQALGVLDAMFLGEPGVLEARQRIELRRRTGARPRG